MNYLLFGGARDTGKSKSIYKLGEYLINSKEYVIRSGHFPSPFQDFWCVLEKNDKVILLQSYTDLVKAVKELKTRRDEIDSVTHVITAIRNEGDHMRNRFWEILKINSSDNILEIPLGKVVGGRTRKMNIKWYLEKTLGVVKEIVKYSPFEF